ncbi:12339_t:CDS:2, partial [Gigaspora margarita]
MPAQSNKSIDSSELDCKRFGGVRDRKEQSMRIITNKEGSQKYVEPTRPKKYTRDKTNDVSIPSGNEMVAVSAALSKKRKASDEE